MMKKITYALIIFISSSLAALCQTNDAYDKEKALVNQIKRNNEYIYADKLDATREGATELAKTILQLEVNRIIADENITEPAADIITGNLEKRVHQVDLKRGNMYRTFLYITREELFSIDEPVNNTTANTQKQQETGTEALIIPETIDFDMTDTEMESDIIEILLPESLVEEEENTNLTIESQAGTEVFETIENVEFEETIENIETVKIVEPVFSPGKTDNPILDEMIGFSKIENIQPFLEKKKREGSVMFGKMESLTNAKNAYLIIYSRDGVINAILDKGGEHRYNFITGKENDSLHNYPECKVAWVQIFK